MTILDYYKDQQKYPAWVMKFQSTSGKQSGKTFSYVNTNYRHLVSFLTQLELFKNNNGRERSEWKTMKGSGQEKDKHRVINLINVGFLKFETECYLFTNKGYTAQDLIDADLTKEEEWLLTFLLCLDYHNEERDLDIIRTYYELQDYISSAGVDFVSIVESIPNDFKVDNTDDLFRKDVFWNITFAKDKRFLELFKDASQEEKDQLKEYVISQHKIKESKDCIAHKFVSGGAYSTGMFRNDLKMIYFVHETEKNKKMSFENYIEFIIDKYSEHFISCNKDKLKKFILGHKSVFKKIYDTIREM